MSAIEEDAVRHFLRERGCPDEVVSSGLEGLIAEWEGVVSSIEEGYELGLDDYLNDLDARQLLDEAMDLVPRGTRELVEPVIRVADDRMRRETLPTIECLWGDQVAESEGWTPHRNWWYFRIPRVPGELLREDLEGLSPER